MASKTEFDLDLDLDVMTPKEYHVFLLNDDYTSMDFVIDILINIFHKSYQESEAIMLAIHEKGQGLCGTYSHEIAETKVTQVTKLAKENGFPLKATMEEA
ncbi:MAG: ATP-dependent Clp protease adaptor ClpS [Thiovulaceae bacterium]|nr:ATP-dependent Clp protease adaptor ClpS [Sulfurimonadaceae bacterium]